MHTDVLEPSLATISADGDPWLTLSMAASEVLVHYSTLKRECRAGRLRHAKVGGRKAIRIRRSWLAEWLEASSTPVEIRR